MVGLTFPKVVYTTMHSYRPPSGGRCATLVVLSETPKNSRFDNTGPHSYIIEVLRYVVYDWRMSPA